MSTSHEGINVSIKTRDRSRERRILMIDRRNLEYQRFCRYFSLPYFGTRIRTKTSVWTKCMSKKDRAREAKNRERLHERITHNFNEMSPYEEGVHTCLVLGELIEKNPDIEINPSKHQGLREALESEEVRRTLVKIRSIFVGTPGYNWDMPSTPHPNSLSIVPINFFSEFHNAELAHIAIRSHRRSAYDLLKARGKRHQCNCMISINYGWNLSDALFIVIIFLMFVGIGDSSKWTSSYPFFYIYPRSFDPPGSNVQRSGYSTMTYFLFPWPTFNLEPGQFSVIVNMFSNSNNKNSVKNHPKTVAVNVWGEVQSHHHLLTGFIPDCYYWDDENECFYSEKNRNYWKNSRIEGHDLQRWLNAIDQQQQPQLLQTPRLHSQTSSKRGSSAT